MGLSKKEEKVYSNLYKIVDTNMKKSGGSMPFLKGSFLALLNEQRSKANIINFNKNDSSVFLECMYLSLFNRFPEEGASDYWKNVEDSESNKKRNITISIVNSAEFKIKNGYLSNDIYEDFTFPVLSSLSKTGFNYRLVKKLKPLGKNVPQEFKNKIKKILRVE